MIYRAVRFAAGLWIAFVLQSPLSAQVVSHWYEPHYLSSIDEASYQLQRLAPEFAPIRRVRNRWGLTSGYSLRQVSVNQTGINLHFSRNAGAHKTRHSWSLIGEYQAPMSVEDTDDIETSIVYADIVSFSIWKYPNSERTATPWCAVPFTPITPDTDRNDVLCVGAEEDAQSLIDAEATLAVATGSSPAKPFGMFLDEVPERLKEGNPKLAGVRILYLVPDGPEATQGIRGEDIVQSVNGKPCADGGPFRDAVAQAAAKPQGGAVQVQILRGHKKMEFDLRYPHPDVDAQQLRQQVAARIKQGNSPAAVVPPSLRPVPQFGLQVRPVRDSDLASLGFLKPLGVLVLVVQQDELADKMGIQSGDVILAVNDSEIHEMELFRQFIRSGKIKKIRVWRKGEALEKAVPKG